MCHYVSWLAEYLAPGYGLKLTYSMDWKRSRRNLGDRFGGVDMNIKLTFYLVGFVVL
jgi:hypothetical protein